MSVQIVPIDFLGASFTIQTDESAEYIDALVKGLRERVDALRASTRVQDPLKLAILAGITVLDELNREKEGFGARGAAAEDEEELSRVTARLIADLDRSLEDAEP